MVIDTSALIAILLGEPEAPNIKAALARAERRILSSVTLAEANIVAFTRLGPAGRVSLRLLVEDAEVEIVPVDATLATLAADAFESFGKGRHPASLNFGDCFVYALAKARGEPILFKGHDFAATDAAVALAP